MKLTEVDAEEQERWVKFGEWLTHERTRKGLTRAEIAKSAAVSYSTLATLEAGGRLLRGEWQLPSPTDQTLVRLGDALGVEPVVLFGRAGRPWTWEAEGRSASIASEPLEPAFMNKLGRLSERDRRVIERAIDRMVDEMLGEE